MSSVIILMALLAFFNLSLVFGMEFQAEKVIVNGKEVKPHPIDLRVEGGMHNAYDSNNKLIYSLGEGHDYIRTGPDGDLFDLTQHPGHKAFGGDAIGIEVPPKIRDTLHQVGEGASCGIDDTPRYLDVNLFADAAFCNFFGGAELAEERAAFYIAETTGAFANVSCLRMRLVSFEMECNAEDDIYTTGFNGEQEVDILWRFRELRQSSSPGGISILLQGGDDGTGVLGVAFVATACRTDYAFGFVEGRFAGAHIMAHEIGHLVSLRHSEAGLMTAYLNPNSELVFSQESFIQLDSFMDDVLSSCIVPRTVSDPTSTPSTIPSPSSVPTSTPSLIPSRSAVPSTTPSATASSSSEPSTTPSATPSTSSEPSTTSSAAPSASSVPTVTPSAAPSISAYPSENPSESEVPSDGPEICHDVNADMPQQGCTGMVLLGTEKILMDGLREGKAKVNIKQSCDNRMVFRLISNRRNLYRLTSLTLSTSYNFMDINEQVDVKDVATDIQTRVVMLTFDTTNLNTPADAAQCCGIEAPLFLNMKATYKYKIKEHRVKQKLWKWSNDTIEVESTYRYLVKCSVGKVNKCRSKRCAKDITKFFS